MIKHGLTILSVLSAMLCFAQQREFWLYSTMSGRHLLSTGDSTWFWGYGHYSGSQLSPPSLPAPLLTVYLGDTVNLTFKNLTGEMHTIHLHGTDVDQRNDGSPHTWPAVGQNDSTGYLWYVTHPGSYFYHCHVMTTLHLGVGMYGMIITKNTPDTTVLYTGGPGFNKEYSFFMTDMDTAWNNMPLSPGPLHAYVPNYFMINGYSDWMMFARPGQIIEANAGDSICLHLGNLGYTTTKLTFPAGANPTVYESDARILPTPFTTDTLRIYPGERYEVILRPTTNISGYIQVDYLNAIVDDSMGTNYIGFNQYIHPTSVQAPMETTFPAVFPNPTTGQFSIESLSDDNALTVFSSDGKLCYRQKLQRGNNTVDCSHLSAGVYFISTNETHYRLVVISE